MICNTHLYFCLFSPLNINEPFQSYIDSLRKGFNTLGLVVTSFHIDRTSKLQGENRSKKMAPFPKCLNVREMAGNAKLKPSRPGKKQDLNELDIDCLGIFEIPLIWIGSLEKGLDSNVKWQWK